jgi:hypothetical protein
VTLAEKEIRTFFTSIERRKFADASFAVTRLRAISEAAAIADDDSSTIEAIGKVTSAFNFLLAAQKAGLAKSTADVTGNVEKAKAIAEDLGSKKPFVDLGKRITAIASALEEQAAAIVK